MIKMLSPTLMLIKAGANVRLSKNFTSREFEDGIADYVLIDTKLIQLLQKLRDHLICPITITSAFRSREKQNQLRSQGYETAKGISTHEVGQAADIWTGKHTGEQLERAARLIGFRSVGVGKSFIHVDTRSDRDYRWSYEIRKS